MTVYSIKGNYSKSVYQMLVNWCEKELFNYINIANPRIMLNTEAEIKSSNLELLRI